MICYRKTLTPVADGGASQRAAGRDVFAIDVPAVALDVVRYQRFFEWIIRHELIETEFLSVGCNVLGHRTLHGPGDDRGWQNQAPCSIYLVFRERDEIST